MKMTSRIVVAILLSLGTLVAGESTTEFAFSTKGNKALADEPHDQVTLRRRRTAEIATKRALENGPSAKKPSIDSSNEEDQDFWFRTLQESGSLPPKPEGPCPVDVRTMNFLSFDIIAFV
jgi:hypothetical protein